MFDALWAELPSQSDITSRLPAFEAPSFEMPSFSGTGCCERAKQSEDKEFLYAQDAEHSTPPNEEDTDGDGHPIPVLISPTSSALSSEDRLLSDTIVYSSSMSLELDSENVEAQIWGAASSSRASRRQPPYVPKLPLTTMNAGLMTVGAAPISEQPSQPLSGRLSPRSVKSLSGWYLDLGRCNSGESTCASDTDHCDDMPQTTTSAWFLDGHKLPSARTSETACYKMSSAAPDYPES